MMRLALLVMALGGLIGTSDQRVVITGTGKPSAGYAITPNVTSTSCSQAAVAAAFAAVGTTTNQVVGISATGSPCHWTTGVDWDAPAGTIIIGEGANTTLGGDGPIIIDDIQSNDPAWNIGAKSTGVLRIANIRIIGGINNAGIERDGIFAIYSSDGAVSSVRLDHFTVDTQTFSPEMKFGKGLNLGRWITGVAHDFIFKNQYNVATYTYNGGRGSDAGGTVWTQAANFGSTDKTDGFFFFEDGEYYGALSGPTRMTDAFTGSKLYHRYNNAIGSNGVELHATGHSGDDRGPRANVFEGNKFIALASQSPTPQNFADASSGEYFIWGNETESSAANSGGISTNVTRKDDTTYAPTGTIYEWGYCGGTRREGVVTLASATTVNWVSGPTFDTSWAAGHMINITGASCSTGNPPGAHCRIASVGSTTQLTLGSGGSSTTPSNAAYNTGSVWDGNADSLGYPCLDQTGRGEGDMLYGDHPDKFNTTSDPDDKTWPRQIIKPVREWMNTLTGLGGGSRWDDRSLGRVLSGRDIMFQASGINTSLGVPFDGTTNITGWGPGAFKPTGCTFNETTGVGPAYFATDEGSWNTSTSNPRGVQRNGADGRLYVCVADDDWDLVFTPATYPHPLRTTP